ncbi:hypothetical protein E4U15_007565 [Claviceps sp. LM218 group G6]|nr:hypothetical protein E4U15_007565 [Claviceps sp. LM218 group G6]
MSENGNGSHTRKNINSPLTGSRKLDSASSEQTGVGDVTCGQKVQKMFRRSAPRIIGGDFEVTVPPLECQTHNPYGIMGHVREVQLLPLAEGSEASPDGDGNRTSNSLNFSSEKRVPCNDGPRRLGEE